MSKKLFVKTFGCQMNEYDSKQMTDLMAEARDYELVDKPDQADLILVNTCSIREKAQEKLFSELGRWRELKEENGTGYLALLVPFGRDEVALAQ